MADFALRQNREAEPAPKDVLEATRAELMQTLALVDELATREEAPIAQHDYLRLASALKRAFRAAAGE